MSTIQAAHAAVKVKEYYLAAFSKRLAGRRFKNESITALVQRMVCGSTRWDIQFFLVTAASREQQAAAIITDSPPGVNPINAP